MLTPKEYFYDYFWMQTNKTSLVFSVKTPNDAHIALAEFLGNTDYNTYEIVLGAANNRLSEIRKGKQGKILAKQPTPGVVSGDQAREFWITWGDSSISVGTGRIVGNHRFMFCKDPKWTPVKYVALSTYVSSSGEWDLDQKYGKALTDTFIIKSPRLTRLYTFSLSAPPPPYSRH